MAVSNTPHRILHRIVPLICQALITAPSDEAVWIEGLTMLCDPKLHTAMSLTASIWLPLLLKGLEATRPRSVLTSSLKLLGEMAETLEPLKSCLVKPLRALAKDADLGIEVSEELKLTLAKIGLAIWGNDRHNRGRTASATADSRASTPKLPPTPAPQAPPQPREQPLLAEILHRNLPSHQRSVRQAWTLTLLSTSHDKGPLWLHHLFRATIEASGVNEMVITSRLGHHIHQELFQTAFLKCYDQILTDEPLKESVDEALVRILSDGTVLVDALTVFLDLVAFFSKEKRQFPPAVADAAKKCALTKFRGDLHQAVPGIVLWYAEQQTAEDLVAENIANLVEVNIRVGASCYDSAWSSLLWLRDDYDCHPNPMWLTQLSHWETALARQDHLDEGGPVKTFSSFNTRMICYHAIGGFQKGYELAQSLFEGLSDHERRKTAHWATAAAWHMGDFETMADYLAFHPKGTSKSLYKAIIDVHHGQYASAFHHIAKAQALSYDELQTQLGVGQMALKTLAKTEVLVELQEVIQYKSQPDMRSHILGLWKARFKRSHDDPNSWVKRLQVWTLACPPTTIELQYCFLDCAKLCESSGMHESAAKMLNWVTPEVTPPGCKVEYTRLRFNWKDATENMDLVQMKKVLDKLHEHTSRFIETVGVDRSLLEMEGLGLRTLESTMQLSKSAKQIIARRYLRVAQWTEVLQGSFWLTDPDSEAYRYYSIAHKLDQSWYTGAYSLAHAAMNVFETNSYSRSDSIAVNNYVVPAIRGLFYAAKAHETPKKMIKALLRLVTVWFRYGESASVLLEVQTQLEDMDPTSWLLAIPQLIARLGTRHKELQGTLINVLKDIASMYPHAIIWPLLTASQTRKQEHEEAARVIMDFICTMPDGTKLVNQAELVGHELIRTSISWIEKWKNIVDRCTPRRDLMEVAWHELSVMWEEDVAKLSSPETPDEDHFVHQFGTQIKTIYKGLVKYRATRQLSLLSPIYNDLYKLYGDLDAQLLGWKVPGSKLHLASVAPRLLNLHDCLLTVPGQYDHNLKLDDQSFIASFHPTVDILSSKQMPRKLVISSYDEDFTFLLKGNEDLRGDERIMQLYTLINTLLNHDQEAFRRNLHLLPYEVIPLSPSAGLIGWVKNTQQLQAMIAANRERNGTNSVTTKEIASLLGYDPETYLAKQERARLDPPAEMDRYDKLPLETKVDRLKAALSHSDQSDLRDVLWQRSPSADIWIRRRTNFARTVGVGSFVGYIIGLGDRHGSNILVDQLTWGAVHIDFGDLFGVAQERSFLPEKVPFRLTRMMTNAFELACSRGHVVPGSRGSFKQASIVTMGMLRGSRSSLLAMLEAFLYDPLLSWTASSSPSGVSTSGPSAATVASATNLTPINATPRPQPDHVPQSVSATGGTHDSVLQPFEEVEVDEYLKGDSYIAKASGTGMTNRKALHVLAQIEKKLVGFQESSDQPLPTRRQVQELIEEASDLKNLAQGYVLGWMPHW